MKIPRPDEVAIEGSWILEEGKMVADEATLRIESLITSYLKIVSTGDGWSKLYRDPTDGRFWEQTYPQSEMQGGGPPKLRVLASEEAGKRYMLSE